jgi:hypothetical protein
VRFTDFSFDNVIIGIGQKIEDQNWGLRVCYFERHRFHTNKQINTLDVIIGILSPLVRPLNFPDLHETP